MYNTRHQGAAHYIGHVKCSQRRAFHRLTVFFFMPAQIVNVAQPSRIALARHGGQSTKQ